MKINYASSDLDQMLTKIKNGSLSVPLFQREFAWSSSEIAGLWTSIILRDEPMGSLVIWDDSNVSEKIEDTNEIFKAIKERDNDSSRNYLIDGQQRMTSFAMSYLLNINPDASGTTKGKRVYLDLRNITDSLKNIKSIKFTSIKEPKSKKLIRSYNLWKDEEALELQLKDEINLSTFPELNIEDVVNLRNKVIAISKKLKNINLGIIEIVSDDLNDVIDVFALINTKGKRLSPFNIVHSLFVKVNPKFDLSSEFEKINAKIQNEFRTKYWNINHSVLLTLMYVIKDKTIHNKTIMDNSKKKINTLQKIEYIKSGEFQKDVINTVRVLIDLGFSKWDLLPSNIYINIVGWYIKQFEDKIITDVTKKRLNSFFKYAILNRRHTSGEDGLKENGFKDDLDFLLTEDEEPEWANDKKFTSDDIISEEYAGTGAKAKFIIAKMTNYLKSFSSGNKVSIDSKAEYKQNLHHIFPKSSSFKNEEYINSLANITPLEFADNQDISNAEPKDYFSKNKYTFKYGLIDHENFSDFKKFVQERAQKIADKMNDEW